MPLAPDEVLKGLGAIVGAGGVSGTVIAITSYLKAMREGRRDTTSVGPAIITGLSNEMHARAMAEHLGGIGFTLARLAAITEIRAEEDISDKGFHDRLESKVDRIIIEMTRAAAAKGTP